MSKCETCKWKNAEDGWAVCDCCVHAPDLDDKYKPLTNADRIRSMSDEELAGYLAKLLADYTTGLYDGAYVPSAEVTSEITVELLRQLQQPYEDGTP